MTGAALFSDFRTAFSINTVERMRSSGSGGVDDKSTPLFPAPVAFEDIQMGGELYFRAMRNFDRMEESRYQPEHVFQPVSETQGWPGDTEGRTVLALTLLAQAAHREPKYLSRILSLFPEKMNERCYFGTIYPEGVLSEQQLSGHGWTLRGLCEYYQWKKDDAVLDMIKTMVNNLVLPTRGYHQKYPINPEERKHGGEYGGTVMKQLGNWLVSTDIGCDFIFLDGLTHAYQLVTSPVLQSIIEEIIGLYVKIDLNQIKAQTHSSLSGMRALLRYSEMTGNQKIIKAVEDRFALYKKLAWTENYENYNWFGRPAWTEPCAVVDSFMVAVSLWRFTGNPQYLEDAHHIYFNGITFEQRANGGFGLSNCTGSRDPYLNVEIDEAHWCCTMRGGEGLSRAVEYSFFKKYNSLIIPFYYENKATMRFGKEYITLNETTKYPFHGSVRLKVLDTTLSFSPEIMFFAPSWTSNHRILKNGNPLPAALKNGFMTVTASLTKDDSLEFNFDMRVNAVKTHNQNSIAGYHKFEYGPLVLGYEGNTEINIYEKAEFIPAENGVFTIKNTGLRIAPIMHLLNPEVNKKSGYKRQVLFKNKL